MKFYIEISILPNSEIGHHFLWEKLYQQLHLALVEIQDDNGIVPVGVSLPEYNKTKRILGDKLRLFANSCETLEKVNIYRWLDKLTDYLFVSQIREVPDSIKTFAIYRRQQAEPSNKRLARRKAKRESISLEEALAKLDNRVDNKVDLPFIQMNSQSTKQRFKVFIDRKESSEVVRQGFSSYGLSHLSTVPEF